MRGLLGALLLVAVGVSQPGGAGTTLFVYDDASSASGLGYTRAEIAAAFPADCIDNGTNAKSYRWKVNLQVGDTGTGAATTTLVDTDAHDFWDAGKFITYRLTQGTSWNTKYGTKVGSGNKASGRDGIVSNVSGGTTFRGNFLLYGSTIINSSVAGSLLSFTPATSGSGSEIVDCIIGNKGSSTASLIQVGSATAALANLYNVDFWGNLSSATLGLLSTFNCVAAERITVAGQALGSFIRSAQSTIAVKDILLYGTAALADIACTTSGPSWDIVKPIWSGSAPRFSSMTVAAGGIRESWLYDRKVVDQNGNGLSGISVKVTDTLGNVQVNTTTNSEGRITFGSGLTANAVIVRDHYGASSYLTRDRSPYLVEINTVGQNTAFPTIRYNTDWPGISTGNFDDLKGETPLIYAGGNPSTWIERIIPS